MTVTLPCFDYNQTDKLIANIPLERERERERGGGGGRGRGKERQKQREEVIVLTVTRMTHQFVISPALVMC